MKNFENAFKPVDQQNIITGMSEEDYKKLLEAIYNTFLDCKTEAGKATLEKYVSTVKDSDKFSARMAEKLKEKADNVMVVRDTDLLIGYVMVDQMTLSIKYYIDNRVMNKLRNNNKTPRSADEVAAFFIKNLGFIPLKNKEASLCELSRETSYRFSTIKRIIEADNSDFWSHTMKVQLLASLSHLEYIPNAAKYYFVVQGKHGWYLRADAEKNEAIKNKLLESKKKAAEAAKEEVETATDNANTEENVEDTK